MSQKINAFNKFSTAVAEYSGRPVTFVLALAAIVVWGISGPLFGFSETWQLVVNTATTIVTFLMVFVLQNSQNRDSKAVQAKLDELILTSAAENEYVGIEELDEGELKRITEILREHARSEDDRALHEKMSRATERQPAGKASRQG
ncbi:low affinity iron permease family protein [Ensifer sp. IC4062]|nr:low affinity iron permease family protein [Ensifer sp. IC4062]MCA1444183.1 low affinity iron permease family protein [Ensifer sp. IC4062]